MQSGGGGGGGPGRNPVGRAGSTSSAAASPSSSSSAVSTPHLGFDPIQQQQQQSRQQLQQQLLRKPEGNEAILTYQAGGLQGVLGAGNFASPGAMSMAQRKFFELAQQQSASQDGQNRIQGPDQQALNPVHQAYIQYAFQAQQMQQSQQAAKMGLLPPSSGKDHDARLGNHKMQDLMAMQAANQAQASSSKNSSEQFARGEKKMEQGQPVASDQRGETKPLAQPPGIGQFVPGNIIRPMQMPQSQSNMQNMSNNQLAMAQVMAVKAWAAEHNIDLSLPGNSHLVAQLIPHLQARMAAQQKPNDSNVGPQSSPVPVPKQQVTSTHVANDNSPRANSSSDVSGQSNSAKAKQAIPSGPFGSTSNAGHGPGTANNNNSIAMHQFSAHSRENQVRPPAVTGNGMPPMHPLQSAASMSQGVDQSFHAKNSLSSPESMQVQHVRPPNRPSPQAPTATSERASGSQNQSAGGPAAPTSQHRTGFTKQQLHVLKAQILAFRRIKKGESALPQELLRAIAPPPLELQQQQQPQPQPQPQAQPQLQPQPQLQTQQQQQQQLQQQFPPGGGNVQEKSAGKVVADRPKDIEANEKDAQVVNGQNSSKEESFGRDEKPSVLPVPVKATPAMIKEPVPVAPLGKEEQPSGGLVVKSDHELERGAPKAPGRSDSLDRGKTVASQVPITEAMQVKKPAQPSTPPQPKDVSAARKYHGPLFDFPFFTRKHDSGPGAINNSHSNNNLTLAYDVKDILFEEGVEVLNKKRSENIKKIGGLLAVNLERKRIRPDLVLRLQIEEKKLRLLELQARLRDEIDQQQQEIMAMPDRPYRKFVRLCERQRMELARQVQASQKALRDKQLKSIFLWRKKLLEAHWAIRDARTARNRGVAKYHEKMLREFSKRKDDDRNKRMEALKNNDVERYREMLLEQQTTIDGDAAERYAVLSSFLTQTEDYLHKLGSKITLAKNQQEVEEAANAAAAAARLQGLSEEEVKSAATCAGEEVMIRNRFREMNAPKDGSSVNKYYSLAHAVSERVLRQPSMLRAGTLRDYQLVGLQWMLSLYNNKLNGILADEMGLGKTVQVMALIAYLMEFKGNYGPHLIIVPNAVLVNWKSELHTWLPSVSCIYYVGAKEQRSKLFSQEVCAMKFNVLVTTYEFIMYDRSKLSKIDWKYIIIDEAQRMKDRESVLARDLDRYRCQRRLLLTGTPLQNDLKELWSLLNLLLPEVFDNKKAFHDWFSKPFQKEGPTPTAEDDWLETEKKVIIIHRLHQILEPFMLRRRVEDVEGSLPPKVSIVLRCRMSAFQSAIYDWIKATGTIRVDPEDERRRAQKSTIYQPKVYKTLNNRCMELRKTCNHPLLNYPYFNDISREFLVRSCGKLWILDRILIKLQRTGHRVLLFSTMTKLLDILEEYLQWRRLIYRRIDGTTSLEDRESAIVDFNRHGSECFIFLLSIRAAGRGLNLQSADTVVIYDPDPNPKNEEQAVARAHRIGQKREVKVIYMEAVVDKISSNQREDELRGGGAVDSEDDFAGKDRYMGSIESLIRNNIQQYKIDMADEVINAGRFDQRTTHEERRMTLETMLHDEERYQETVHDVPSLHEVNRMIARSEEEVELFDQMDEELDWVEETTRYDQVPKWLRAGTKEMNATIAALSKRPLKKTMFGDNGGAEGSEMGSDSSPKTERRRGRPKGKKHPNYKEIDDDIEEYSEASSDERNGYSMPEEEGEIGDFEDEEFSGAVGVPPNNKDQVEEEDAPALGGAYEYPQGTESIRNNQMVEEAGSSGSSSDSRRVTRMVSPASQKFGSLSALDSRPGSVSRRMAEDLEEGEIAVSGDSHVDHQQSGSWIQEREEPEDEQVLQPKIKRKRSLRIRPRHNVERPEEKPGNEMPSARGDASLMQFQADLKYQAQVRGDHETKNYGDSSGSRHEQNDSSSKSKRNLPGRRIANASKSQPSPKSSRYSMSASADDANEHPRDNWDGKVANSSGPSKMSDIIQRRCKNVISKLQRRIDKEGHQIVPLLTDLWKRIENSGYAGGSVNNLLDLRKIDQRIERLEYSGVMELVSDVQSMLRSAMNYYAFSHEVRSEARKVQDLFFDILKIAFPDTDFREARSALSFSGPIPSTTVPSPRQAVPSQSKRHKMINEVEPEPSPLPKSQQRGSMHSGEDTPRGRGLATQKESRLGSGSGSSREQYQQDDAPRLTHPGDLVICKKKRKDREKTTIGKPRTGAVGPVSPPSLPRGLKTPGGPSSSVARDTRLSQQSAGHSQGWANQSGQASNGSGGGSVGWANPVKRLRTDSGKRRPSHL